MLSHTLRDGRGPIVIREAIASDLDALRTYYRDLIESGSAPWFPLPHTSDNIEIWLKYSGFLDFEQSLHWLGFDGDRIAGHLIFQRRDMRSLGLEGIATANLTVAHEYRQGGLGGALMDLWSPTATERLKATGVRRIVAHIFPENGPSRRLAARVGLKFEGILRQHMKAADGKYHDMLILGQILQDEPCGNCQHLLSGATVAMPNASWGTGS